MNEDTRHRIRRIFLDSRLNVALITAGDLLEMSFRSLKKEVADGAILAVPTRVGLRIPREELIAAAMRIWPQTDIEEALGDDAARVLPDALRLVELRARIPAINKRCSTTSPARTVRPSTKS
jgi:hypothetical protein